MGITRAPAPSVSGPVASGAVFGQRPGLSSSRPSGLNRRAGMGMKLSDIPSSSENKSSLGGIFGNDFEKWSQIVYCPINCKINVVIRKIHDFDLVGRRFYILREWISRADNRFR